MSISVGNFVGGKISAAIADAQKVSGETGLAGYQSVLSSVMMVSLIAGVALLALSRPINKWITASSDPAARLIRLGPCGLVQADGSAIQRLKFK
jgi:hypothetical protein